MPLIPKTNTRQFKVFPMPKVQIMYQRLNNDLDLLSITLPSRRNFLKTAIVQGPYSNMYLRHEQYISRHIGFYRIFVGVSFKRFLRTREIDPTDSSNRRKIARIEWSNITKMNKFGYVLVHKPGENTYYWSKMFLEESKSIFPSFYNHPSHRKYFNNPKSVRSAINDAIEKGIIDTQIDEVDISLGDLAVEYRDDV